MTEPNRILLLAVDSDRQATWSDWLSDLRAKLWQGLNGLPVDASLDVILTDDDQYATHLAGHTRIRAQLTRGETGVVRVGAAIGGDVCLPADCSRRELKLASSLLAEVVRLRRQCRRSKRMRGALQRLAYSDPLTGLPNRRAWEEEVYVRTDKSTRQAVALLDLDAFKAINDHHGHMVGDEVLCKVARILEDEVQHPDFVARLGGDEFVISLTDGTTAAERVDRIRRVIKETAPLRHLTASAGLAIASEKGGLAADQLLRQADLALRRAKALGRNRLVCADSDCDAGIAVHLPPRVESERR